MSNIKITIDRPPSQPIFQYHPDLFFDKIFIINLDTSPERWDRVTKELIRHGIVNFERQRGIYLPRKDPSYLDRELYDNLEAYGGKFKFDANYILNAVGTNRAHFEIVKKAIKRNYTRILVLEDDIFLHENFFTDYLKLAKYLDSHEWDLAYLGYKKSRSEMISQSLSDDILKPTNYIRGAYGYALNFSIYPILIKNQLYKGMEIDAFFEFGICKYRNAVCLKKPIICHRDGLVSTITNQKWKSRQF